MEELYRRADKFSTLEDKIRAASQTIMITAQGNKSVAKGPFEHKRSQGKSQKPLDGRSEKKKDSPQFTALNIAYERLVPIIRNLPDFKWPQPIRASPDQRNKSLHCEYHRDHGHETNQCQSLKFLLEKLIRASLLRRFLREPTRGAAAATTIGRLVAEIEPAPEPRSTINFILGGPIDNQYQSNKQRRRLLRTASVKARVNAISDRGEAPSARPVDGPWILSSY